MYKYHNNIDINMNPVCNSIQFSNILYNPNSVLSKAAFAQIMVAISHIPFRPIRELDKTHKNYNGNIMYLQLLLPWLSKNIPVFVNEFKKLLEYKDKKDHRLRYYTLGCNGLPKDKEIPKIFHNSVILHDGNLGPFLDALFDRIGFIKTREYPPLCIKDPSYVPYFKKLQKDVYKFRKTLIDFQNSFMYAVDHIRNQCNFNIHSIRHDRIIRQKKRINNKYKTHSIN